MENKAMTLRLPAEQAEALEKVEQLATARHQPTTEVCAQHGERTNDV